eukprot:1276136-Prymnesium_polylepis.1
MRAGAAAQYGSSSAIALEMASCRSGGASTPLFGVSSHSDSSDWRSETAVSVLTVMRGGGARRRRAVSVLAVMRDDGARKRRAPAAGRQSKKKMAAAAIFNRNLSNHDQIVH